MPYPEMSIKVEWSLIKGGFHKTPHFNTLKQETAAWRGSSTISLMPYAAWDFEVDLNSVDGGESVAFSVLQRFLGCYMACKGGAGLFLFTDPNDNTVKQADSLLLNTTPGAAEPMGTTGDGTSIQFQLARKIDQAEDIIQFADAWVYVNGTKVTATISDAGVVAFASPPPSGAVLTCDGPFKYLCRFTDDTLKDLARVNRNLDGFLWSCSSISFRSVPQ